MTDLVKALDDAAAKLLQQAGLSENAPDKIEASPAERVKAFDSVLEYAKMRPTLIPKEVTESAFDRIQRKFNGEKAQRRGRAVEVEAKSSDGDIPDNGRVEEQPGGGDPIVVNGAAEPATGNLFDA